MLLMESLRTQEEREQRIEDLTIEIEELEEKLWEREQEYEDIVGELEREEYEREGPIGRTPTENDEMYFERKEELDEEILPYYESLIKSKKEELKKLESLEEQEAQKLIERETFEPSEKPKILIKKNGSVVLKTKILRGGKGYISRKLPSEKRDPEAWKKARGEKLGASDLASLVKPKYNSQIPYIFLERLYGISSPSDKKTQKRMERGKSCEKEWHKELAQELERNKKVVLGEYTFSDVYLSKNRQYSNTGLENLGSQLDAWGIWEGIKTVVEYKSTGSFSFNPLKKSLEEEETPSEVLKREKPEYYYQIQAQMLCTGCKQGIVVIEDRKSFETLCVMIQEDKEAQEWIKLRVKEFEKALGILRGHSKEHIEKVYGHSPSSFFQELNPSEVLKQEAEEKKKEHCLIQIQENLELKQELVEFIDLEETKKKKERFLTSHYRFMAGERKFLLRCEDLKVKLRERELVC